jgi:hypothetical protein
MAQQLSDAARPEAVLTRAAENFDFIGRALAAGVYEASTRYKSDGPWKCLRASPFNCQTDRAAFC